MSKRTARRPLGATCPRCGAEIETWGVEVESVSGGQKFDMPMLNGCLSCGWHETIKREVKS